MLKYIMAPYKNKNYRIYNVSLYCQIKRYRHISDDSRFCILFAGYAIFKKCLRTKIDS